MDDKPQTPPENPTLGRRAGYHLDENGNVTGYWFTVDTKHFVEFTEKAINYPPGTRREDLKG